MNTNVAQKNQMDKMSRLEIAHNALKCSVTPKSRYFLEDFNVLDNGTISVTYINEDNLYNGDLRDDSWLEGIITNKQLEAFIDEHYSTVTNGYSNETLFKVSSNTFWLEENIRMVILAYLNAGKEFQNVSTHAGKSNARLIWIQKDEQLLALANFIGNLMILKHSVDDTSKAKIDYLIEDLKTYTKCHKFGQHHRC